MLFAKIPRQRVENIFSVREKEGERERERKRKREREGKREKERDSERLRYRERRREKKRENSRCIKKNIHILNLPGIDTGTLTTNGIYIPYSIPR